MSSTLYEDKYFLNSKDALEESLKENYVLAPNKQVKGLQICYYDGEVLKNAPKNCINVPFENFVKYFSKTKNRIPTEFCDKDNIVMYQLFKDSLLEVNKIIEKKIQKLEQKIKELKPNFQDKKLRVFAFGCRETVLIKYIVENIIEAAKRLGLEVYLHKQTNNMQSCSKLHYLKALYKFNPHMTININHLNNSFLNKYIYNFIWFQDQMPVLLNNERIGKRERDYFFHLTEHLTFYLRKKGISSNYQPFCIDTDTYKIRNLRKRNNIIVFIGSSYKKMFDSINNKDKYKILQKVLKIYLKKGYMSNKERKTFIKNNSFNDNGIIHIYNYIERDLLLLHIVNMKLGYKIEIYGHGWEVYSELHQYYKGTLKYGKDISKVYNNAKYCLVLGGYVMQQRTLEGAASGAIPLVFDVRASNADFDQECFDKSLVFFNNPSNLYDILQKEYTKDLSCIVQKNSYLNFVKKILNVVGKNK